MEQIIGNSAEMQTVKQKIKAFSTLDAAILIEGETGTGKELVVNAIHRESIRRNFPLVKINCAALSPEIVESELFGHIKGAFSGAVNDHKGKFEYAENGTIFLDEISELSLTIQAKLLRVLQEKEVVRLGSNETRKINFRVVAATNKNLSEMVRMGTFRADLLFRLQQLTIYIPPLRARGADIALLAEYFGRKLSNSLDTDFSGFTSNTITHFRKYDWPGNVRELKNRIQQQLVTSSETVLHINPKRFQNLQVPAAKGDVSQFLDLNRPEKLTMSRIKEYKENIEKACIEAVLQHTRWRVSGPKGAAKILKVNASTLDSRLKKLGISTK
ncbi:sigma-54-dependent Fis family transcriptional regulator [Aquimarina sp. U1-2]|uniref:sigma-54 interaction domain-containing protein n=1 Tax=Aquimarina sp. U1-2 TaxID=2823141 RepID=UPI001AED07B6|nr:sigma-54 dependent transcriptional regulator [Aquimarina sp. U1-2]MBP2831848.1 sigma-54-dependent Fis family transcriptional regulator [Aquimarina sp. U1-2]